jgi:hypothetical protein
MWLTRLLSVLIPVRFISTAPHCGQYVSAELAMLPA